MPYNNINFGQQMPGQGMDYGQQDQASLFQQIQQYQEFLAAQKEKEKQLGNNQSILAGQYAGQDADIATGKQYAQPESQQDYNDRYAQVANKFVPDQAKAAPFMTQLSALQQLGPEAYGKGSQATTKYMNEITRLSHEAQFQGQSHLAPDQVDAEMRAGTMGRLNDANSLLSRPQMEQGVSPSVLGQFGDLAQKAGAEGGKSRTAGILGQSEIDKQQVANIGQIGAAQATAQGNVDAAQATAGATNQKLTKATMTTLEQGVTAIGSVMNQLSQLGKDYDPEFASGKHQALASFAGMAEHWGLGTYDKEFRDRFARFSLKAEQQFNAYRKVVTGAAASDAEIERLKESYFNLKVGGPVEQKAKLSELLVQQGVGLYAAAKALKAAKQGIDLGIGEIAKPGTAEFGQQVEALSGMLDPTEIQHVKENVMAQYPGLLQTPAKAGATANGQPFDPNAYRMERIKAKALQGQPQQGGQ